VNLLCRQRLPRPNSQDRTGTGRVVGAFPFSSGRSARDVALVPSLLRAARRGSLRQGLTPEDLLQQARRLPRHQLIVFVVDASESMGEGSRVRMAAAKGAVLALLKTAYVDRCRVALVAFRGDKAEVLLMPTRSIELARERLKKLPVGGATPFADGLWQGWRLVRRERARDAALRPLLVVISDGEANVPLQSGRKVMDELLELAAGMRREHIPALVIDSRDPATPNGDMERLAQALGTKCRRLGKLKTGKVLELLRAAAAERA
jgi:magnesium chelatase subunit ChlD-like protein